MSIPACKLEPRSRAEPRHLRAGVDAVGDGLVVPAETSSPHPWPEAFGKAGILATTVRARRELAYDPQLEQRWLCAQSHSRPPGLGGSMHRVSGGSNMKCHNLGKRAYRVSNKFELVTITSPLFDMDFLKVDFKVAGLAVTGMALRQVGADMDMNKIETYIDPDQHDQGVTDTCGEPIGTIRVMFRTSSIAPFDIKAQALVIHEGVHASLRRMKTASAGHLEEAAAYLAQALFFELKGESILQTWIDDNQWLYEQPHIDDPVKESAKAQIYASAEKLIEEFDLDSRHASLTAGDVAELVGAIAKDPGYPVPPKPRSPKSRPRPMTLRERIRERREKRRARWAR